MKIYEQNLGPLVLCDLCNKDWTNNEQKGGLVFESKAVCPTCAPKFLENVQKYNEECYIKTYCPSNVSFADFIRSYRGGDGRAAIYTASSQEEFDDFMRMLFGDEYI